MNKKRKNLNNVGAALVITLIVVTVVSAIAFSINRMLISEVKQISRLEDSEMAYLAAESGIETGLLLYRYNHNVEVPRGVDRGMDESQNRVMRVDISNGKLDNPNLLNPESYLSALTKLNQYYDLRIWHKNVAGAKEEGIPVTCNAETLANTPDLCVINQATGEKIIPAIPKDGTVEYDVSGVNGDLNLTWDYTKTNVPFSESEKYIINVIPVKEDGTLDWDNKHVYNYEKKNSSFNNITTSDVSKIRIESFGGDLQSYKLKTTNPNSKLDSRYTYIESTGYYGNSKRKIKVTVDRQSGSVYGVYNFVILTDSDVKPN
jgi:hypothetical protein